MFENDPSLSVGLQIVPRPSNVIPEIMHLATQQRQSVLLQEVRGFYQFRGDAPHATHPFKVDTGASVTLIKRSEWDHAERLPRIQWLHELGTSAENSELPGQTYPMTGISGQAILVYFGLVTLRFFEQVNPNDPIFETELVAAFEETGILKTTLLGLGGNTFSKGGLCLNGSTKEVHLVQI